MIRDIETNNRGLRTREVSFDEDDLGYLAILPKVLVRSESGNELY
jgi:hypothetical protein